MNKKLIFLFCLASSFSLMAEQITFSYNTESGTPKEFGNSKAEIIDVAVKLYWPALVGKKIKALSVPLAGNVGAMSDFSGFLTTELKTRNSQGSKINDPDICSVEGTVTGSVLTVSFPDEYVIPEKGVYIGYSFKVNDPTEAPTPVSVVDSFVEDAFWFRGSESQLKWRNEGLGNNLASVMSITVDGDFSTDAALPFVSGPVFIDGSSDSTIPVNIISQGVNPVKEIEYSWQAGEVGGTGRYELPVPVGGFGKSAVLPLAIEPLGSPAKTEYKFTIDRVNGNANGIGEADCVTPMEILPFMPINRPLVEEYTGLRCGYCPRGWVILRQMGEDYSKNKFVALSYHSARFENGAMVYLSTSEFPYSPSAYPAAQVNRRGSSAVQDIPSEWKQLSLGIPEGDMEVSLQWAEDEQKTLKATSRTRFIHSRADSPYRVAFALVADDLSDPDWAQYNAYRNYTENTTGFESEYWDLFIGKDENIYGLTYDDIVVYFPNSTGIPDSLPDEIEAGAEYLNEFSVDTEGIVNVLGQRTVKDFNRTRVVGMIIDTKTGYVVNSVSSSYPDGTELGMASNIVSNEISEIIFHDICGRRVMKPCGGVFLKTSVYKDGSCHSEKILVP